MMHAQQKIILPLLIVTLCVATFAGLIIYRLTTGDQRPPIELVQDESYFSDFYISEEKVYIRCTLALQSSSDQDERVSIRGFFPDDVTLGLLQEQELYAWTLDEQVNQFFIPANGQVELSVVFVGEYAGHPQKSNRLLPPKIEIDIH